jgi:hypothetical protein
MDKAPCNDAEPESLWYSGVFCIGFRMWRECFTVFLQNLLSRLNKEALVSGESSSSVIGRDYVCFPLENIPNEFIPRAAKI